MKAINDTIIFSLLFLFACNSNTETKYNDVDPAQAYPIEDKVLVNYSDTNSIELRRENGLEVLDSLYKNVHRVKEELIDNFSFVHSLNKRDSIIKLNCIAKYEDDEWGYTLKLKDSAHLYKKDHFQPSEDFQYVSSNVFLNNKKIGINVLPGFESSETIHPVNVWYGKDFGPVAKIYKLSDRTVFLIQGINYYCNGSHCSNYKVIILQKFNNKPAKAYYVDYPGIYPFDFDGVHLFYDKARCKPQLYVVKKGRQGNQVDDFDVLDL